MKKYTPSVRNNNQCRELAANELRAVIYRLEKGKYDAGLDSRIVKDRLIRLTDSLAALEDCIGTGEENIGPVSAEAIRQIKQLKKMAEQSMIHRFEEAADELEYTLGLWKDVLDGNTVLETEEEVARVRESRMRRKLNARLAELEAVKASLTENDRRLETEIAGLEKDLNEYNDAMLNENNERRINELYRSIKTVRSKIDMLNVRHGNYSACYNLLDMIYANAKEILRATDYAGEEIAMAKVFLDIEKLKKVVVDPDKAIAILRQMDNDIKAISVRTASLDKKVFGLDSGGTSVNDDALAYKEELMRKQREKQEMQSADPENIKNMTDKTEVNGDGVL